MSSDNPNMKLRMPGKDYTDPGYYFCTRSVLGRRHLFGKIKKHGNIPIANPECAYIDYSPFGIRVSHELEHIGSVGQYAGKVEVKGKQIMPDHIHVLIFIKERLPKPLGTLLNGFTIGCRRIWKELMASSDAQNQIVEPEPQADGALRIFERGFNDNVVYKAGQLDGYYKYMAANPWRWLLRESYPDLFCKVWGKELMPGHRFDLIGNMFLMDRPWRVPVRISRFAVIEESFDPINPERSFSIADGSRVLRRTQYLYPKREKTKEEIQAAIQPYLKQARAGAVLVTPCISPAEKEVVQAAYKENLAVVMLCYQGFNRYYHPSRSHYDACARGILLQLAPWKYDHGREMRKALCEELNELALRFAHL